MAYTGTSIVDYLKSIGQDSSYSARSALASQYGITNYTGSADQNLALLSKLKNNSGSTPAVQEVKTLKDANNVINNQQNIQQNTLLTNALTELQKRLTTNTTPKTTSDIKDTSIIPEQSLYTKSPALTTTTADSINSMIQKEQEALAAKQASAQKTLSDAGLLGTGNTLQEQLLTGYKANVPVSQYQTKLAEAQNRYGVIEALDEYKLQGEKVAQAKAAIENLDLQRQTELDAALNRQASMNSISAEQQRINQKYDSQRAKLVGDYNIEAAILATKSNNLTEANKLVSQAVDAYASDITAEINRFNNFYSIASDFVSSLSSEEKSVLDDVKTQLINKEREEKERLTNVLNLKLEYPSAGIEATDTLEQATAKAENWSKENPTISQTLGSADTGYTMYDKYGNVIGTKSGKSSSNDISLTDSQIITGSQKAHMSIDEYKNLSTDDQAWFLTGRYENALDSIASNVLSSGIADTMSLINNDTTMPEAIKKSLLLDIIPYVKSSLAAQTTKIYLGENSQTITLNNLNSGATSSVFGNKDEKSELQDMSRAAKSLGYGVWYTGGGAEREELSATIMNWIDEERNSMRDDASIFKDVRNYLMDAKNGTVTSDNPFIKY